MRILELERIVERFLPRSWSSFFPRKRNPSAVAIQASSPDFFRGEEGCRLYQRLARC